MKPHVELRCNSNVYCKQSSLTTYRKQSGVCESDSERYVQPSQCRQCCTAGPRRLGVECTSPDGHRLVECHPSDGHTVVLNLDESVSSDRCLNVESNDRSAGRRVTHAQLSAGCVRRAFMVDALHHFAMARDVWKSGYRFSAVIVRRTRGRWRRCGTLAVRVLVRA